MLERVFNITDVPTPLLEQFNLVNGTIVVGKHILSPGESADIELDAVRSSLDYYLSVGAVAIKKLPAEYALKKAAQPPPEAPKESTLPFKKKKKGK